MGESATYWTEYRSYTPYPDPVNLLFRRKHIRNSGATSGKHGTPNESSHESEGQKHGEVLRVVDTKLKEYKGTESANGISDIGVFAC